MDIKVPDYCSECILWDYCDFSTSGDACKQRIEQEITDLNNAFLAGINKAASWEAIPTYDRRR